MSFEFTLEVDDLVRYQQRLEAAAEQVSKAGRRKTGKYARLIAADARRNVHVITGRLRASIGVGDAGGGLTTVTASAPYAGFEEYGTVRRPPHPYMRPAVARYRRAYLNELQELGGSLLGTKTAARGALVGAVPRGSTFGPGGAARAAARAGVESGGTP